MLKSHGWWWVAHVILVSAQVPLVLTLGLWTLYFGLELNNNDKIMGTWAANVMMAVLYNWKTGMKQYQAGMNSYYPGINSYQI